MCIFKSSGSLTVDRAALALLRKAAPFKPFPIDQGRLIAQFDVKTGVTVEPESNVIFFARSSKCSDRPNPGTTAKLYTRENAGYMVQRKKRFSDVYSFPHEIYMKYVRANSLNVLWVTLLMQSTLGSIAVGADTPSSQKQPGFGYGSVDFAVHPLVNPQPKMSDDDELRWWFGSLRRKITRTWEKISPTVPAACGCSYTFVLQEGGQISDVRLLNSSTSKAIDDSLLAAIKNAAPVFEEQLALHKTIEIDFHNAESPKFSFKLLQTGPSKIQ